MCVQINPPPEEGCCECCGRHVSELKPFGGPGDPLVGDFTGAFLVKHFRQDRESSDSDQWFITLGPSWECRDCIVLGCKEYYERLNQMSREHGMQ